MSDLVSELPIYPSAASSWRTEDLKARAYRLVKRPGHPLVLQGCFYWQEGDTGGMDWRDIPTVEEETP